MTRHEQLQFAVRVLASSFDEQIDYLRGVFGEDMVRSGKIDDLWNIDELALQFADIACARNGMLQSGEINSTQHDCVADLDEFLNSLSGMKNSLLWTIGALRSDPRWDIVRKKAQQCLALL